MNDEPINNDEDDEMAEAIDAATHLIMQDADPELEALLDEEATITADQYVETTAVEVSRYSVSQLDRIEGKCDQILGMLLGFETFRVEAEKALEEFASKGIMGMMGGLGGLFGGK